MPEFQVDAIHLAIALAYYGLLRVPSRAESSDVDIRKYLLSYLLVLFLIALFL